MMHSAPAVSSHRSGLRGLGVTPPSYVAPVMQSAGQLSSAIQSGNVQALTTGSVGAAGAVITAVGSSSSMAGTALAAVVPVIGPVIAGVMIALTLLFNRKGPKQKVATTKIVDAVEPKLKENRDAYLALPVHYYSAQQAALANFDAGWAYVQQHCNIPEMGEPGTRCTNDRQRGGQWDWFVYYRDPIANDTAVVPDPAVDSVTGESLGENGGITIGGVTLGGNTLLIAGGALLLVAMASGGSGR